MEIGSFLKGKLNKKTTYSYYHRGSKEPYLPDNLKEEAEKSFYSADNGNLFYETEVSWNGSLLLFDGIDISFRLGSECFIDHIELEQGKNSHIKSVEVLTNISGKLKKIGLYNGETGEYISKKSIVIPVGFYADNVVLRLNGACMDIAVKKLDIWGAWDIKNSVWPLPESISFSGKFPLSVLKTVKAVTEQEKFAAEYLREKFFEKTNINLGIVSENADISLEIKGDGEKDSYSLISKSGKCDLSAVNKRSLLYAADALLQLVDGQFLKEAEISHEDFCQMRGVHFGLPNKNQIDFLKNMVKYVFVPGHYNMAFIEVGAGLKYDKFPEINRAWTLWNEKYENGEGPEPVHYKFVSKYPWEKSEVRELCEFFKAYGIEVVPEVQSLGHTQYITYAHPEMVEKTRDYTEKNDTDLNVADAIPTGDYHCMCPNHPEYYNVIFGVLDEVIEAFRPERFVHMGHDEAVNIGKCSRCTGKERGDIFAKEVNTLNQYVKGKNLRMMIWSDMLQDEYYAAPKAIDKLDKDIIMLDFVWYFHTEDDIEDRLLSRGFNVMMGNMYSSHYTRFEKRIRKEGMVGAEVSTWSECSELSYASAGKMYELVMSAASLSSCSYNSSFALTYNEIIKPILKELREKIGGLKCDGEIKKIETGGSERNIPSDIRGIVPYNSAVVLSEDESINEIIVDDCAKAIKVTHATLFDGKRKSAVRKDLYKTAVYEIVYEDGSSYEENIYYGGGIYSYHSAYGTPIKLAMYRHVGYGGTYMATPECGKTHSGEDYTLYSYSFKNPEPSKKIMLLRLKYCGEAQTDSVIFNIELMA